ncbi:MAG: glutamate--tRNA ligase [Deinococcaceae bacterium]
MIVTRIAPSPTGEPHVGTAYQALLNYVFARANHGKFIVRIEDTDRTRFREDFVGRILEMLDWLGLTPDESSVVGGPHAPYVQSERLPIYRTYAEQLLERGRAYRAFDTPDELTAMREEAERSGASHRGYNRRYRDLSPEESQARADRGEPFVIRLKVPLTGKTTVNDQLRGKVEFDNTELDDKVLLKSDGFPTYHLAAMVDDHLMGITHVIRAEEWLVSTPFHVLILGALDWPEPQWIHTPLLRNPDKSKLSKRKSDTSVDSYRAQGILPQVLLNYLGLMAWSMPDGREIFSLDEMTEHFDLHRISLGAPVFDIEKLKWMNGKYLREVLSPDEVTEQLHSYLSRAGHTIPCDAYFKAIVQMLIPRMDTFQTFLQQTHYFWSEDFEYTPKAQELIQQSPGVIGDIQKHIENLDPFEASSILSLFKTYAKERALKLNQVMPPIRAAVAGTLESPDLDKMIETLGKHRVSERLTRALKHIHV